MKNNIFGTLLKRASYTSTGTLTARLTVTFAVIIMARVVGPSSFGVYASLWALIQVYVAFSGIGMIYGLQRDGSRSPNLLPSLLGNTLIVKGIVGIIVLFIASHHYPLVSGSEKASALYFPLALAAFAALLMDPFFAALQVKGRQKRAAFLEVGRSLTLLVGFGILAVLQYDIRVFAWLQAILYIIALLIVYFLVVPIVSLNTAFSRIRPQLISSLVFGVSSALYTVYTRMPILFLSHFRPSEEVGYFAVAFRFIELVFLAGAAASNNAFLPSLFGLYKTDPVKCREVCEHMQTLFVSLGILAASALYVCSDALIVIIQGVEYRPAVESLRILCWVVALNFGVLAAGASLTAGDRMWTKVAFQMCVTFVVIITSLIVIKSYGFIGASYVMLILWLGIVLLYIPYAHRKALIGFSGLSKIPLPAGLTAVLAFLVVKLMPNLNLLGPAVFFLVSLILWRQSLKTLREKASVSIGKVL